MDPLKILISSSSLPFQWKQVYSFFSIYSCVFCEALEKVWKGLFLTGHRCGLQQHLISILPFITCWKTNFMHILSSLITPFQLFFFLCPLLYWDLSCQGQCSRHCWFSVRILLGLSCFSLCPFPCSAFFAADGLHLDSLYRSTLRYWRAVR